MDSTSDRSVDADFACLAIQHLRKSNGQEAGICCRVRAGIPVLRLTRENILLNRPILLEFPLGSSA